MRTERVAAAFEGMGNKEYLECMESPESVGRAVVALASDQNIVDKSGRILAMGDLAGEYGFTAIDGRRIPAFRMPDQERVRRETS
ncbi:MAG TPA: hypothetical protein VLI55_21095 [Bryobacteraceae bacterium]|nr:hypothetical protein [Bryobacteraceae bacterium]